MQVSMVQENFIVGDIIGNYEKICKHWDLLDKDTDLIVFSELCLTGYPAGDLYLDKAFLRLEQDYVTKLSNKAKTMNSSIIFGFVESIYDEKLYNAAMLLTKDNPPEVIHKTHLPNYDVFDEKRYFSESSYGQFFPHLTNIIKINKKNFLILICEDMWKLSDKNINNITDNLEGIIVLNASPWDTTKISKRKKIATNLSVKLNTKLYYVNQIGGQDDLVFDGSSFIMHPEGQYIQLNSFECDVYNKNKIVTANLLHYIPSIKKALVLGIRDYFYKNNFKKAIIGISGGVDSAVVADLAVEALGCENVLGIGMMTEFNSNLTKKLAKELCVRLNISYKEMDISKIIEIFNTELDYYTVFPKLKMSGVPYENLQSRIRGNILMSISNKDNALVLSTGNKSEISMGYCTLYGDMTGGFNPLKDVYKKEVYGLASYSNNIPKEIISRPPSAELAEGQLDSDKLPDYEVLDLILSMYLEGNYSVQEVSKLYDKQLAERVYRALILSEYKRQQSCPGIKITSKYHGKDRRYPITNQYKG